MKKKFYVISKLTLICLLAGMPLLRMSLWLHKLFGLMAHQPTTKMLDLGEQVLVFSMGVRIG